MMALRILPIKSSAPLSQRKRSPYYKKTNGGKHTAINLGVNEANGELFWILDSDDSLPNNAIETILSQYAKLSDKGQLAGICGLMAHHDGT